MRLHALHVQGLRSPRGVTRIDLDTAFNLLLVPDAGDVDGLRAAIESLLYPDSRRPALDAWIERDPREPARLGLSLTLGADGFRIISDLASRRVYLGRFDKASGDYARVSTDAAEIEARLREGGLPDREQLFEARALGWDGPIPATRDPAAEQRFDAERSEIEAALVRAEAQHRSLEELEARASRLRAARERFVDLERTAKLRPPELERLTALGDRLEGLEDRVTRYRALVQKRDASREVIASARQGLLEERSRLRALPARQRPWTWLGLALGAAGVAAAELVDVWLGAFALAGIGIALTAIGVSASARRRAAAADTSLAALRVRERSAEREFESKGADVRSLMVALELDEPERLLEEAGRYRELVATSDEALDSARRDFPEEAELELGELEERVAVLRAGATPAELRARLAEIEADEEEPEPVTTAPALDPAAIAARIGRGPDEFWSRLEPVLPAYLRTLSGGSLVAARWDAARGWLLSDENGAESGLATLPAVASIALRCALIEAIGVDDPSPLFVGPIPAELEPESNDAVARALRRLGSLVQVVQITHVADPWSARADAVHRIG